MLAGIFGSMVVLAAAVYQAIISGVGWSTINSSAKCDAPIHTYVFAVTVFSTILLVAYLLMLLFLFAGFFVEQINVGVLIAFAATVFLGGMFKLVWFIWGAIVLSYNDCKDTSYWSVSIAFVVLSILAILPSFFASMGSVIKGRHRVRDDA